MTAALLNPLSANAAGFAVQEQGARGLWRAFAGDFTDAREPSELWSNPAASAIVDGRAASGSLTGIYSAGSGTNRGSSLTFPNGVTAPTTGPSGKDPLEFGAVPSAAIAKHAANCGSGVTLNAAFGFTTSYLTNFSAHYGSKGTQLRTINLELFAARRFGDRLTLRAGAQGDETPTRADCARPAARWRSHLGRNRRPRRTDR
jgi:long-subunit fatty acid transport protein